MVARVASRAWYLILIGVLGIVTACGDATGTTTLSPPSTTIAPAPTTSTSGTPSTAPDASVFWIVFQSPDGLRLIRPDGQGSTPALPAGPIGALHPDWSPDGQRLAFAVDAADGTRDIWMANWDGTDAALVVDCQAPCRDADSPAWSRDGSKIAFNRVDNVDGHNPGSKIQTIDVATGEIVTIFATEGAEYASEARWSPDGGALVVTITRYIDDGNDTDEITGSTIAVVDLTAATVALRPLRPFDSYSGYPDWHPTQNLILFVEGENLFTVRPDGSGVTQITHLGPSDDPLLMPAFRFDSDGILATRYHRASGGLTLVAVQFDSSEIAEFGDVGGVPGAHSRQMPTPTAP